MPSLISIKYGEQRAKLFFNRTYGCKLRKGDKVAVFMDDSEYCCGVWRGGKIVKPRRDKHKDCGYMYDWFWFYYEEDVRKFAEERARVGGDRGGLWLVSESEDVEIKQRWGKR